MTVTAEMGEAMPVRDGSWLYLLQLDGGVTVTFLLESGFVIVTVERWGRGHCFSWKVGSWSP